MIAGGFPVKTRSVAMDAVLTHGLAEDKPAVDLYHRSLQPLPGSIAAVDAGRAGGECCPLELLMIPLVMRLPHRRRDTIAAFVKHRIRLLREPP